jgi:predicted nucleic acid-binding Zn ribbon protein
MSAPRLTICPREVCPQQPWGKGKVKRAIGAGAGLIFKGSGFYITDYRSDKYREAAKKDAAAPASTSASAKAGTEASPKARTEARPSVAAKT